VPRPLAPRPGASAQFRQRIAIGLVGVGILLAAGWLALVVASRIDELFLPGRGLSGLPPLPGVQDSGDGPQGQVNILVMGLDRRPHEGGEATRTDTMFVVTIDSATKRAGILGIPRDLWVEIPFSEGEGYFEERVNTVFLTGEDAGYRGGGPSLVKQVIERNLGIPIDYYVVIDFEGFVKIIDELGGVDVYVENEIYDPFYSRTELPGDFYALHFEVGPLHMDGQTALDYSRTRYGTSDLERIQRQQQVIFAAMEKAVERRLVSPDNLLDLWGRYKGAIDTDINDLQAPGFASLAAQIEPERITSLSLGVATRPWTTPEGAAVLLADKEIIQRLVQALFADQQLAQEAALVEVQNGAGTDGLADLVVGYLEQFGFEPRSLAAANTADGGIRPLTEIIDFTGKAYTAQRLAGLLGVPDEHVRQGGPEDAALRAVAGADIVVVLGADAQGRDFRVEAGG
jgi:LCP family protein required for cell wall assembly